MRLVTYRTSRRVAAGVVSGSAVHSWPPGVTMLTAIGLGPDRLRELSEAALDRPGLPLASVTLLPPLAPPAVRDFVCFEEHVEGMSRLAGAAGVAPEWYEAPAFYFSNPHAVLGAHDDVPVPPGCERFDFELEVAAVVGRAGRDLRPDRAGAHILGYTILNDWSARDLQLREMRVGLGPCKGKDSATTLGPWLVTADELAGYRDSDGFLRLGMRVEVNGVEIGRDLLSNMAWPFEDLAAYASRGAEIRPGDVLGSGTCGNGGCLAELWGRRGRVDPPPLRPGDLVTMTVDGIGTISNRVVPGTDAPLVAAARPRPRDRP
jgi:2-keto-4-pentenoate hydratase/2-oxohepta-3-ene-1,7-dioic acid hydratase in catechol pathway